MLCSRLQNLMLHLAVLASVVCLSASAQAAKPTPEKVELFAAMKAEQIEVKFVPKDATQATVMIKNKTDRPLSIQLPQAFAGIPVLAQNNNNNNGGGGGRNNNSSSTTNSQQSIKKGKKKSKKGKKDDCKKEEMHKRET